MRKLLLGFVMMSSLGAHCADLQFIAGSKLREKGIYDEIPALHREEVVVSNAGFPSAEVSFVFRVPFDRMTLLAEEYLNSTRLGAPAVTEITIDAESSLPPAYTPSSKESAASNLERIRRNNINIVDIQTVRFDFPIYNTSDAGASYSKLQITIANAKSLFSIEGSIIVVTRIDVSRVNLRTFHLGIPLPIKKSSEVRLVTSTEVEMIDELQKSCGQAASGVVLSWASGNPFGFSERLEQMKALLQLE